MKIVWVGLAACLTVLSVSGPATGAPPPRQFLANINSGQETPPNASNAFGVAHLTFDAATDMLCFSISYNPAALTSAESVAHIHGPALPGVAAGILFNLPAGSPKNGCVGPLTSSQQTSLGKNLLYINVHTANFELGEIRGQILRIK